MSTFDKNTVVLASAGTGKTRRLVEVYLELLERGSDPLRIAAVTFTEKAAAEMRERIRSALYAKPGHWMKTIALLPVAPISTIHGFCGILLRERGFGAGIDPGFTILDEQRSLDLAREAARETIRQEIRSGNEDVEQLFGDFGFEGLVETVVSAGYWLNSLGAGEDWLRSRIEDQRRAAAEIEKEIADEVRPYGGADFQKVGELADELEGRKAKHALRKRDDPNALLPRVGQIAGVAAAERLSSLVALSTGRFRTKKRAAGAMDFDDLLLAVRNLLKDDDTIRRHYQNRFQALLVDEFQDTDEVQADIISLLAEDPLQPGRLSPQKLMIVGDPKQSIYRFRRARVTVFFRMLNRIREEGGDVQHLQDNYRSAAPIVEFSNQLCSRMMDGRGKVMDADPGGIDFSYRVRFSEADRLKPKSEAEFLGITYVAAEEGAKAAKGREMEAEAIARLLKQWKASGRIRSWREVALLMRAMTNVEVYLSALEAHEIPVYVVQGTAFYQKSEISDLIAFLELVLRPGDELLRATVLTSSLFGMTFQQLAGSVSPAPPDLFEELLSHWSGKRDTATAAEILQDIIRRTDFDAVMIGQKNGPQRAANIGKLIEITRELGRQGTTALDDVVRYLRERAHDTSVRESEAQIVSQADEVVRVLTIHQAKGLEFDIVIIPDLAARTGRSSGERTFFSDRWGLLAGAAYGLHRKPLPHALVLQEKRWEDDQQYEEEKRLLYVAVTRARKMLVLGEGFSKQGGPWLQWIGQVFESVNSAAIAAARAGKSQTVRFKGFWIKVLPASQLNVPEQLTFATDAILVAEPDIPRPPGPRPVPELDMTPSDLGALNGCFRFFHWTRILGLPEPGCEPSGDTPQMKLGSIAHNFLETAVKPPAAAVLKEAGVPDLENVFESSAWLELAAADPERELPFIMHLPVNGKDCWVRGRMDAAVGGDLPRVIDYKYAVWHEPGETAYEIQMTAYGLALMKALGTDRAVAELWYLKAPMKIIRREYARDEAESRLRKLFSRYFEALDRDDWPAADRSYCDRVECGFRERCWGTF
ncbi:MAG TPA: UvrD-helicase domain-containing protein [Terriglobia bacterium]|jgi:ATP-dependent helicase/nuclease subunit A